MTTERHAGKPAHAMRFAPRRRAEQSPGGVPPPSPQAATPPADI